jgi:multidrug efflux pump subunit AcrB
LPGKKAKKQSSAEKVKFTKKDAKLLPKFSLFFFDRPKFTALLMLLILAFGVISYTTLLKREGFPSINFPVASINGTYIGNAETVDSKVAKPIAETAMKQNGVASVQSQSFDNFFNVFIQYEETVNAQEAAKQLESELQKNNVLPEQATVTVSAPYFSPAGIQLEPVDIGISVYGKSGQPTADLLLAAESFTKSLNEKNLDTVEKAFVINPFNTAINPFTGQSQVIQKTFDAYGQRESGMNELYPSVLVGVSKKTDADLLKFDSQVNEAVSEIASTQKDNSVGFVVSASYAPEIKSNIAELQRELLIALLAVLLVGALVIALRASLITVFALIIIIFAVIGLLYLLGFTLNVITLFALILSLALIVDDTIIMVEAIDAQRKKQKDARKAVSEATRKISRAMLSATFVAVLSFVPLLFVGGILGTFIRAIPATVISALLISLLVSLIFIPFFAKFLLLNKKSMGEKGVKEVAAGIEQKLAKFIAKPMLWAKGSYKKLTAVGMAAIFVGVLFIGAGGYFGTKVAFNIFPSSKDANNMQVTLSFAPGTNLQTAEQLTNQATELVYKTLGENLEYSSLYNTGSTRDATLSIKLISYSKRDIRSPQLVDKVQKELDSGLPQVQSKVVQLDAGPPAQPFTVVVVDDNREASFKLANDIAAFFETLTVTRPDGTTATVTNVNPPNPNTFVRSDGNLRVPVSAEFDASDTTRLFNLAEEAINNEFTPEKVESYGLDKDAIQFDLGQEAENQESFAVLGIAFPLILLSIYILLAIQFRSLLQPILIFFAIPFSFFGITLSLYLTDNPFSFFAMLGFFALIGLSIKNTILLTDYANQARKSGMGPVDAIVEGLQERFRPLIATSLTAVVAITPLAILSPFWQGLAVLIIFGLLSSTLLVITVFPYYYLGAEFLKINVSRKLGLSWLIITVVASILIGRIAPALSGVVILLAIAIGLVYLVKKSSHKIKKA